MQLKVIFVVVAVGMSNQVLNTRCLSRTQPKIHNILYL